MPIGVRTRSLAPGLVVLLTAALAGCQALPLRRAQQPAQAEAAMQPDPTDWQAQAAAAAPLPIAAAAPAPAQPTLALAKRPGEPEVASRPTPLLDAALERSRAQQQAILSEIKGPAAADPAALPEAVTGETTPEPSAAELDGAGTAIGLAAEAESDGSSPAHREGGPQNAETGTELSQHEPENPLAAEPMPATESAPASQPAEIAVAEPDGTGLSQSEADARADESTASHAEASPSEHAQEPAATASEPADSAPSALVEGTLPTNEPSLAVTDMRLCRRVRGFGNVEPIDPAACKPGQTIVLYCEMAGLRYEHVPAAAPAPGQYRSQLASWVEIVPEAGGSAVWSQALGEAEDLCGRPRRDYYVSYRLTLPPAAALPPGSYQLHLKQEDVVAGRTTTGTLAFTVQP